jgi:HMG (high mobility group) box
LIVPFVSDKLAFCFLFHSFFTAPSRPLSAYNLFFREEKEVWMAEKREAAARQAAGGGKDKGNFKKGEPKVDEDDEDDENSSASDETEPRSFEAMAKALGSRWRHLAPEKKQRFVDMATKDQQRYRREMELYKEKLVSETVLGAAYLKKQRLQQEQAAAAAQGEDGTAPPGGEDGTQGEESGSGAPCNAQVPSHIGIPAVLSAFASPSGGTASSTSTAAAAAAPLSSDIAQQILFLQQQQRQQHILLSPFGQAPYLTSHDLWMQHQQLQVQQRQLQREQMILDAAVATAQRSSHHSQLQAQLGSHHHAPPLDAAAAALFANPSTQPHVSVELQQTLWRLQQQQQAHESNQLHNLLSQIQQQQQQQQQQASAASQNLSVRTLDAPPPLLFGFYTLPQLDLVPQQNLLNDYNLGGQQHVHQNASAALSQIQQQQQQQLLGQNTSLASLGTAAPLFGVVAAVAAAAASSGGGGLTREQMDLLRSFQQQQEQPPSTPPSSERSPPEHPE